MCPVHDKTAGLDTASAAARPTADAISARTAASSGGWRKWMASDQRPGASSKAEVANSSASKLSASASAIFRAVEASLESRATTVAMGEGSGIARLSFVPSPDFTAEYPKPASANPQMVNNLIR
jgi:hypothetical protein